MLLFYFVLAKTRRRWEILEEMIMLGESTELPAAVFSSFAFCTGRQSEEGAGQGGIVDRRHRTQAGVYR